MLWSCTHIKYGDIYCKGGNFPDSILLAMDVYQPSISRAWFLREHCCDFLFVCVSKSAVKLDENVIVWYGWCRESIRQHCLCAFRNIDDKIQYLGIITCKRGRQDSGNLAFDLGNLIYSNLVVKEALELCFLMNAPRNSYCYDNFITDSSNGSYINANKINVFCWKTTELIWWCISLSSQVTFTYLILIIGYWTNTLATSRLTSIKAVTVHG